MRKRPPAARALERATPSKPKAPAAKAAHLEALIVERTSELEEKTQALEAANHELRSLMQNLDQMVRKRTRALAESEAELRRKNAQLDRLIQMKSEFVAVAAHELRTPLTTIVGYLELLVEKRLSMLPLDLHRPMQTMLRSSHRLKRLVNDMFDVSRLETGRINLRWQICALPNIVSGVIEELEPLATAKEQRLCWSDHGAPKLEGDPDRLHQVLANLVANSIKYTPKGGRIEITLDEMDVDGQSHARIRVWDSGMGIPEPLRRRIFEPFGERSAAKHHTSTDPDSAGLGLFIARGLVDLHGGTMLVHSEVGQFSEFTVYLPRNAAAK